MAVALVLLLVGAPLAWRLRPSNETERTLVGTWAFVSDDPQRMHFRADRRLAFSSDQILYEEIGSWTAAKDGLRLRLFADDARIAMLGWFARLQRFRPGKLSALRFHDPDRALIYGIECRRIVG